MTQSRKSVEAAKIKAALAAKGGSRKESRLRFVPLVSLIVAVAALFATAYGLYVSQRAYVALSIGPAKIFKLNSLSASGRPYVLMPVWSNAGNTPALDGKTYSKCGDQIGSGAGLLLIPPHATYNGTSCLTSLQVVSEIIKNQEIFRMIFEADYKDVFGLGHRTISCQEVYASSFDDQANVDIVAKSCSKLNCIDDCGDETIGPASKSVVDLPSEIVGP